ncbi:protein DpdH [Paracoccaceae bacterium]|nr:protein DpdH [Paracoccaceae bacterium]
MTDLSNYWPKDLEINACIKNEAETAAESVLLAVHREVTFLVESSNQSTEKSERDFLENFLTPNVPSGALIMPVLGASGIGKSHVIRWLQAQILRQEGSDIYHIIRIPKTANLKKVVELILEPLKNNVNYDKIRQDLDDAVQSLTEQELITTFVAELTNEIRAYGEQAQIQAREENNPDLVRKLRREIGYSKNVPFLFTDAVLQEYFNSQVFTRLTKRSFVGGNSEEEFDELPQFKSSDFDFPESLDISKCATPVHKYILTNITGNDNKNTNAIVDFLNGSQLIDRAIKKAYKISGDFGGKTLEELILDIRDELFKENKELVLLIEDFAALTGFQDTILNVAIQEGQVDGNQVRATMRTAIAVTDGYQLTDTISTRAKSRWRIQSREFENNERIIDEMSDMVGAYLNAARWGKDNLDSKYLINKESDDWVGVFEDEGIDDDSLRALDSFGRSSSGFPLFPFNQNAIKVLANSYLRDKTGVLVFTPRELINHIIRPTLLQRDLYKKGLFPHSYENVKPRTDITLLASRTAGDEFYKKRILSVLAVWGGNPDKVQEIGLDYAIFNSFGLNNPLDVNVKKPDQTKEKPISKPSKNTIEPIQPKPLKDTEEVDEKFLDWKNKIEEWSGGVRLSQTMANSLRSWLFEAVERHISWDLIGIPKLSDSDQKPIISIAHAAGEGASGDKIVICDNHTDPDGKLRAAFNAIYRLNKNNFSFDYDDGDHDYENLIDLIQRISVDLIKLLRDRQIKEVKVIAHTLQTQARVLGFRPPRLVKPYENILNSLFLDCSIEDLQQDYDLEWKMLCFEFVNKKDPNKNSWRDDFKSELLKNIASYQGETGRTPQSIDLNKLITAMESDGLSGQEATKAVSRELKPYFTNTNDRRVLRSAITLHQKIISDFGQISDIIGDIENFDQNKFIESMQNLATNLVEIGCYPRLEQGFENTLKEFGPRLSDFADVSVSSTVKSLEKISKIESTEKNTSDLLNELGVLNLSLIAEVMNLFEEADKLCKFGRENILAKQKLTADQDLGVVRDEIKSILEKLRDL